jgi:hypothetical protein
LILTHIFLSVIPNLPDQGGGKIQCVEEGSSNGGPLIGLRITKGSGRQGIIIGSLRKRIVQGGSIY